MCKIVMYDDSEELASVTKQDLQKIFKEQSKDIDELKILSVTGPKKVPELKDEPDLVILKNQYNDDKTWIHFAQKIRKVFKDVFIIFFSVNDKIKEEWFASVDNSLFVQTPYRFSELENDFGCFFNRMNNLGENNIGIFN